MTSQVPKINKPKYVLPDRLTLALSHAIKQGMNLSRALDKCNGDVKEIQNACVQILIESITLTLAASELLELHYAFPAEVVFRAVVDRVSTVQHIAINGEKGLREWKSNKLPALSDRVKAVHDYSEDEMRETIHPHIKLLHQSVHSDATRRTVNMGLEEDSAKYWLGQNPTRPEQCEILAGLLATQLKIIDHFISSLIDEIANPQNSKIN